jgi:preprotein translocase SecE subunit
MGTVMGAALILLLSVNFLYSNLPTWIRPLFDRSAQMTNAAAKTAALNHASLMARDVSLGACAAFLVGACLLVYWLINRPTNADFLIATDSEMKKVNWTSRKELIGSTKVVIVFMFLIAIMLFAFDIFFGYLFYFMDVLKTRPF